MPGRASQKFEKVSAATGNCLRAKASAQGIKIVSDSGTFSQSGFTVSYTYDSQSETLSLT